MKKSRAGYRTTLAVWILALLLTVSAEAGTLAVTTTSDSGGSCPGSNCTLRQALATAVSGDTIVFQIPTTDPAYDATTGYYTITLTGATAANKTLVIAKNVTIDGGSGRPIVVRRANNAPTDFRVFNVNFGITATLSRIWISNGNLTTATGTGFEKYGAGIRTSGSLTVRDCIFTGNAAEGGSALNIQGATTITRSTFSGNSATNAGGAIYTGGVVFVTIDTCTFTLNNAAEGGAIYNNHGVYTLRSCTISGNTATSGAGTRGGGGIVSTGTNSQGNNGSTHFENTIVAGNSAPLAPDVWGTIESEGHNLIGNADSNFGFTGTGDQVGVTTAQLNLKTFDYYDAFLPTMPPNSGSFAIDKGKQTLDVNGQPSTTDQRGQPRPIDRGESNAQGGDGNDIGAVEVGAPQTGPTFTVTTTGERNDGSCTVDDCTLVEALNVTNAVADANTINFTPGLAGAIGTAILTPSGLAITNPVTINGPGPRTLGVTGRTAARVFNVTSSNVTISGLGLVNGRVTNGDGGIIRNTGGLTLTNCTLSNGFAAGGTSDGGAIHNALGASLTLNGCTVSGSKADAVGGGIFNEGIVTATNCTFSGNSAIQGGGIYSAFSNNASKVSLRNCTITKCSASDPGTNTGDGGGGYYAVGNSGQYNLGNSLIAGNTTAGRNPDLRGNFFSDGHNFIGDVGFASGLSNNVKGDQIGTSGSVKDPLLFNTLANNGGPTDTHALLTNSTAIGGGDDSLAPATDQRGYFRSGTSDIGAFEFNGIAPAPPTVVTGSATNITSTSATLNASVNPNGLGTTFQFVSDFASFAVQDAGSGAAPVAFSINVTGLTPNTQYNFNATATSNGGTIQGVQQSFTTLTAPTPTPTPTATPGLVGNVSTRLPVGTGDNALFEGFIVQGPAGSTKKIMVRAIGPSLLPFGVADALGNPILEIRDSGSAVIAMNDDWGTTQVGGIISGDQSVEIGASGLAPGNNLESAIIANLAPGSYTAVVRGVGDTVGTGVVDAYDMSAASSAKLANVATRGLIQPGDKLMIAGFIIQNGSVTAVVRAIGPSLAAFGITNALPDTTLQLRDQNGAIVQENDDWQSDQKQELEATSLQPSDPLEAAVVVTIPPGQYTAQVRGKPETTGTGVVQVYFLQ